MQIFQWSANAIEPLHPFLSFMFEAKKPGAINVTARHLISFITVEMKPIKAASQEVHYWCWLSNFKGSPRWSMFLLVWWPVEVRVDIWMECDIG